ncbi:hypothetical protein BDZ89DRAFT_1100184 [Hymenopellis radicata]|nr:hypothetical protein BDZ89DRAFT_1100184 [Hymenopellis radicata]
MSAFNLKQAFGREKPHSSITDWIEILTANTVAEEAYDGIPELVDSINLQPHAGPTEASRAVRKKLKHGTAHQQYRALVILKALVENCGDKFKSSFTDGQLTDAIKHLASDSTTDRRSWHDQFQSDPSMHIFSSLYVQAARDRPHATESMVDPEAQKRKLEEARRKAQEKQEAKERARLEEEKRKKEKHAKKNRPKRTPFNFETEKPKVLASIVDASQASSNLVNAIMLVNTETDSVQTNQRVQECLDTTKLVRKQIVRYIQLVENEEIIGTLIESNERIINSLLLYDNASKPSEATDAITAGLAKTHLTGESEVVKLQEKQRVAVQRAKQGSVRGDSSGAYADLQDINFGSIGASSSNLPPPLRPSTFSDDGDNARESRGSLSDFSDYDSSDEDTHNQYEGGKKDYYSVSDDSEDARTVSGSRSKGGLVDVDDPFADPFADEVAVGPSKKW